MCLNTDNAWSRHQKSDSAKNLDTRSSHPAQEPGLSKTSTDPSTRKSQKKTPTSSLLSLFFRPVNYQPAKPVRPVKPIKKYALTQPPFQKRHMLMSRQSNLHKLSLRRHTSPQSRKTRMFPSHVPYMSSTIVHSVHDRSTTTHAAPMLYPGPHPKQVR